MYNNYFMVVNVFINVEEFYIFKETLIKVDLSGY